MSTGQTLTTEAAVRNAIVAAAGGEVGKHYGLVGGTPNPTPYGRWYGGETWARALFCAAGATWAAARALSEGEADRLLGHQTVGGAAPYKRGFVWTVAMWQQHAANRVVGRDKLHLLEPGDLILYKYPTSGTRNTNPVNHVDVLEVNNARSGYLDCIGFNVPRPGAPAGTDQSRGGGVWRRRIWYSNPYIVGGVRVRADHYAEANRAGWAKVQQHLQALEYGTYQMTGTYGPATQAGVNAYAADTGYTGDRTDHRSLLAHMEATMSKLDRIIDQQAALYEAVQENTAAVRKLPSVKDIAAAVWAFAYDGHGGFNAWWWLRRGSVLNPTHRAFPADPGSPAHRELVTAAEAEGGRVQVYTAEGPVLLDYSTEDGSFRAPAEVAPNGPQGS